MAWTNLFTHDPATEIDVYLNGVLLDPSEYATYEIEVFVTSGIVELAYNAALLPAGARLEALARPSTPVLLPQRIANANGDPWVDEGTSTFASLVTVLDGPPPENDGSLGPIPGVTHDFDAEGEFSAVGMGVQF